MNLNQQAGPITDNSRAREEVMPGAAVIVNADDWGARRGHISPHARLRSSWGGFFSKCNGVHGGLGAGGPIG